MNEKERYYRKIERYKEKKNAWENLKVDFKSLIGINKEKKREIEYRYQRQVARECLSFLIWSLLFEENPYQAKQELKENKIAPLWFKYYKIDIYYVTKEDVDVLFEIMKKI